MNTDNQPKKSLLYEKIFPFFLVSVLICLVAATCLLSSVPPVDRDALTHHLFVPKLWLQHGGIYEIPEIPFSYYPMNLDLLYAIPLFFGNDIIPKYIHYCFALATALLLYRHLTQRLGKHYGLLGAIFFLSLPIIVKLSITVYVDLGVVFFTTAALLLLLRWAEQHFQVHLLIFAGICCGLAAGTKYNGLIGVVVLTLLVPILYQQSVSKEKQSNGKALLWGSIFVIATLTTSSPWLMRNYLWTGNPIYPLHNSLFQKPPATTTDRYADSPLGSADTTQQDTFSGENAFVARKILYNETWWQALLLPVRFFLEGQDDNPQFFDGKLSPFLLLLPLVALAFKPTTEQRRREQRYLFLFALLYFFLTFFQQVLRIRYIVAIVPALVILSMYGLHAFTTFLSTWQTEKNVRQSVLLLLVFCITGPMLWYNLQYVSDQFASVQPIKYLTGKVSREEYIATFRPEYQVIQFANTAVPPKTKVLCLFLGNRGYFMDFEPVFEQPYSTGLFARFLATPNQNLTIVTALEQQNIKYILMRDDLTASWLNQLNVTDKRRVAPLFVNASQPLLRKSGHSFFPISPANLPKRTL